MIYGVVGLGYGDEGKGKTVAKILYALREHNTARKLVVRYNGGPQAGHSVTYKGQTHIYSSFGAGTFINELDADTFWSRFCTFDPVALLKEYKKAEEMFGDLKTKLYIDHHCPVILPCDKIANTLPTPNTGLLPENISSSCGSGHGPCVYRNTETPHRLAVVDLFNMPHSLLVQKIDAINTWYLSSVPAKDHKIIGDLLETETDILLKAIRELKNNTRVLPVSWQWINTYKQWESIVFEGAQGTLLDQHHGIFPHVTRSNTTFANATVLLKEVNKQFHEIFYVTRAYLTRHGSGPFDALPITLKNTDNEINVTNPAQGEFRTGEINTDLIEYAIDLNRSYLNSSATVGATTRYTVVVNNLDQVPYPNYFRDYFCNWIDRCFYYSPEITEGLEITDIDNRVNK